MYWMRCCSQHLLRQMLAKDYRLRCNLDTIVVDDWVTFEGSEPLFEKDPYLIQEYTDFETVLIEEDPTGPPPLHILLVCPSLVIRTMLHQQINNVTAAVCVCASNGEEAMHIIRSAMESHPEDNFDYIFSELLLPTKRDGLAAMKFIRNSGFKGKIIGMTTSNEDMDDFLTEEGADAVVRRPIANRELSLLLTKEEFEEIADTMLHKTHGAPPVDKITAEEFDNAITFNAASRSHSMRTMSFSDSSSPVGAVGKIAITNEVNPIHAVYYPSHHVCLVVYLRTMMSLTMRMMCKTLTIAVVQLRLVIAIFMKCISINAAVEQTHQMSI